MLAGFQLIARSVAYVRIMCVGVAKIINVSAPDGSQCEQLGTQRTRR